MKIEYIIKGKDYQELVKNVIPLSAESLTITTVNKKLTGVNNYILYVEINGKNISCAKILSKIAEEIEHILNEKKITYYQLTDEPSNLFAKKLYPLVCEFETKLRKLVYYALFDLDKEASEVAIDQLKQIKKYSKITHIPTENYLERITLGEFFSFLFDNRYFIDEAKEKTKNIVNDIDKTVTKKELQEIIDKIEEKTIWKRLFAEIFSDFSLPNIHREIFFTRNDVMHFHNITHKDYQKASTMLRKINKELDIQLDKGIILEKTTENVEIISAQYAMSSFEKAINAFYTAAQNIDGIVQTLNNVAKYIENLDIAYNSKTNYFLEKYENSPLQKLLSELATEFDNENTENISNTSEDKVDFQEENSDESDKTNE
ncbi:MAG: hypothetical protein E7456_01435 [Ruminococcaceae bacterium]|nr:hypothetical protein [Oscillospiraceae bacterium]